MQPFKRSPNLTEKVSDALRTEITDGRYRPGAAMPAEHAMAVSFGVSRTVMREAVQRLKAEGFVETHQGRGVFVADILPSPPLHLGTRGAVEVREALNLLELRAGFDVEAAGLAAERRTEHDLNDMQGALDQLQGVQGNDITAITQADLRFHRAICTSTCNPHFLAFFNYLSRYLADAIALSWDWARAGGKTDAHAEHSALLSAIAKQDGSAAREAARLHVRGTVVRFTNRNDQLIKRTS